MYKSYRRNAFTGGHVSPPLRLGGYYKFMAQAVAAILERYFRADIRVAD